MITAKSENQKYLTALAGKNASILADVGTDIGGSGNYLNPHDLLEAAFACCMDMTVRMVLDYRGIPHDGVTVKASIDESAGDSAVFHYSIDIDGVDGETRDSVVKKAQNCPIRKLLSKRIEFVSDGASAVE